MITVYYSWNILLQQTIRWDPPNGSPPENPRLKSAGDCKGCVQHSLPSGFLYYNNTDGWFRHPANSPVEVGRLTQGFSSIPGGEPSTALAHLRSLVPWDEVGHPGGVPRFRETRGTDPPASYQPPPWGNRIRSKMAYDNQVYQETWLLKIFIQKCIFQKPKWSQIGAPQTVTS